MANYSKYEVILVSDLSSSFEKMAKVLLTITNLFDLIAIGRVEPTAIKP